MTGIAGDVEFAIEHEEDIKYLVFEAQHDPATQKTGGGGRAFISDPTARQAMRNFDEVRCVMVPYGANINGRRDIRKVKHPQRWLEVTSSLRALYGGSVQWEIVELKYVKGLEQSAILATLRDKYQLEIGRSNYYDMVRDVIRMGIGVATGLGLNHRMTL